MIASAHESFPVRSQLCRNALGRGSPGRGRPRTRRRVHGVHRPGSAGRQPRVRRNVGPRFRRGQRHQRVRPWGLRRQLRRAQTGPSGEHLRPRHQGPRGQVGVPGGQRHARRRQSLHRPALPAQPARRVPRHHGRRRLWPRRTQRQLRRRGDPMEDQRRRWRVEVPGHGTVWRPRNLPYEHRRRPEQPLRGGHLRLRRGLRRRWQLQQRGARKVWRRRHLRCGGRSLLPGLRRRHRLLQHGNSHMRRL